MRYGYLLLCMSNILDMAATDYGVRLGLLEEANPFLRPFFSTPNTILSFYIIKILLVPVLAYLLIYLFNRWPRASKRTKCCYLYTLGVIFSIVSARTISMLIQ